MRTFQHSCATAHAFRATFKPEQFFLKPSRCQSGAVERNKGPIFPLGAGMNHTGGNFFARTRPSANQYARTGGRHFFYLVSNGGNLGTVSIQFRILPGLYAQFFILTRQPRGLQRAPHNNQQTVCLKWLFYKIVSTMLERCHGCFNCAMARNHDNRNRRFLGLHGLQDSQAIHVRTL